MSVLINWLVVPNRLHTLLKQVAYSPKGILRDDLAELMNPPSLNKDKKTNIFEAVLNEAIKLDLVLETLIEGEKNKKCLQLNSNIQNLDDASFIRLMENRLLQVKDDKSWDHGRFPEALTWLLMQDPLRPLVWDKNFKFTIEQDLGKQSEALELTSNSCFQNLFYWARFLGFAVRLGFTSTELTELTEDIDMEEDELKLNDREVVKATAYVLPDPTIAIARHLPTMFCTKKRLNIDELLEAWSSLLPVLEHGAVRNELEQQARSGLKRRDRVFSRATSLALRRLAQRKVINLQNLSDAKIHTLDYGHSTSEVSHIDYTME